MILLLVIEKTGYATGIFGRYYSVFPEDNTMVEIFGDSKSEYGWICEVENNELSKEMNEFELRSCTAFSKTIMIE